MFGKMMGFIGRNKRSVILASLMTIIAASRAAAFTAPAGADEFAYDVYDIAVNRILNGPIGFVAGVGCMVAGAAAAIVQKLALAALAILGGAILLNADSMVESLGMIF